MGTPRQGSHYNLQGYSALNGSICGPPLEAREDISRNWVISRKVRAHFLAVIYFRLPIPDGEGQVRGVEAHDGGFSMSHVDFKK